MEPSQSHTPIAVATPVDPSTTTNDEERPSPQENNTQPTAPPPPPSNPYMNLPEGWTTAVNPEDGRIYYWQPSTGETSWVHPEAPTSEHKNSCWNLFPWMSWWTTRSRRNRRGTPMLPPPRSYMSSPYAEDPAYAGRRPDNHQCNAVVCLIMCPPIGLLALYHSIQVDRCWSQGLYSDAVVHARQVPSYSCFGIVVGLLFWMWFFLFREEAGFEWPDWKFD